MVSFAKELQLIEDNSTQFEAIDGLHEAKIMPNGIVVLHMQDVNENMLIHDHFEIQTGSPHYVKFEKDVLAIDVVSEGRAIRNNKAFPAGINVNFVEVLNNNTLFVRTYERGVENETLACGTGAVASAIAAFESGLISTQPIRLTALGGDLEVLFSKLENTTYTNIRLIGSAKFVFKGSIDV